MTPAKWGSYKNFSKSEFDCKHTGKNEMKHEFLVKLQEFRDKYGKPVSINSGYRHPTHPVEARKGHANGEHTKGMCADIHVPNNRERYHMLKIAFEVGFPRIGFHRGFLHLGLGDGVLPSEVCWDYQ